MVVTEEFPGLLTTTIRNFLMKQHFIKNSGLFSLLCLVWIISGLKNFRQIEGRDPWNPPMVVLASSFFKWSLLKIVWSTSGSGVPGGFILGLGNQKTVEPQTPNNTSCRSAFEWRPCKPLQLFSEIHFPIMFTTDGSYITSRLVFSLGRCRIQGGSGSLEMEKSNCFNLIQNKNNLKWSFLWAGKYTFNRIYFWLLVLCFNWKTIVYLL